MERFRDRQCPFGRLSVDFPFSVRSYESDSGRGSFDHVATTDADLFSNGNFFKKRRAFMVGRIVFEKILRPIEVGRAFRSRKLRLSLNFVRRRSFFREGFLVF